jgi:Tol biopolymer transport system component
MSVTAPPRPPHPGDPVERDELDRLPVWSPDGRMVAFVSRRDGNEEIYVMNADGSGQRRLTRTPWNDKSPAWSPAQTR